MIGRESNSKTNRDKWRFATSGQGEGQDRRLYKITWLYIRVEDF